MYVGSVGGTSMQSYNDMGGYSGRVGGRNAHAPRPIPAVSNEGMLMIWANYMIATTLVVHNIRYITYVTLSNNHRTQPLTTHNLSFHSIVSFCFLSICHQLDQVERH